MSVLLVLSLIVCVCGGLRAQGTSPHAVPVNLANPRSRSMRLGSSRSATCRLMRTRVSRCGKSLVLTIPTGKRKPTGTRAYLLYHILGRGRV